MKQTIDESGKTIDGLFRNTDGSLMINNSSAYIKNKIQHDKFAELTNQVKYLNETVNKILEKINGS